MAVLDDLINKITDLELRKLIKNEVEKLNKQKKFGLVYEDHLPEFTILYDSPINIGSKVTFRDQKINNIYVVTNIKDKTAKIFGLKVGKELESPIDNLVIVAEFGEPIYLI